MHWLEASLLLYIPTSRTQQFKDIVTYLVPSNNHQLPDTGFFLAALDPEELPHVDSEERTDAIEYGGEVAHQSGQHHSEH